MLCHLHPWRFQIPPDNALGSMICPHIWFCPGAEDWTMALLKWFCSQLRFITWNKSPEIRSEMHTRLQGKLYVLTFLLSSINRKNKNDISKLIFKSGDFQMSPYAEYPKNPRAQEWGRETIEMQENGSTKNLLQMTDVYYSVSIYSLAINLLCLLQQRHITA